MYVAQVPNYWVSTWGSMNYCQVTLTRYTVPVIPLVITRKVYGNIIETNHASFYSTVPPSLQGNYSVKL